MREQRTGPIPDFSEEQAVGDWFYEGGFAGVIETPVRQQVEQPRRVMQSAAEVVVFTPDHLDELAAKRMEGKE